jgi:hypothetical protein
VHEGRKLGERHVEAVGVKDAFVLRDQRRKPCDDRDIGDPQRHLLLADRGRASCRHDKCGDYADGAAPKQDHQFTLVAEHWTIPQGHLC